MTTQTGTSIGAMTRKKKTQDQGSLEVAQEERAGTAPEAGAPRAGAQEGEEAGEAAEPGIAVEGSAEAAAEASPEIAEEVAAERAIEAELDRLQGELEALNDRHLRLAAEFENYRKRIERERSETWTRAQADLVRRILEVLDDLERVCATDPSCTTVETLVEGVELVRRKMAQALEQAGLQAFDPAGQAFDPTTMEAVMTAEADAGEDDDTVAEVFQKGYTFRGHLVRPARVVVRKHG